jgi:NTE family protein
MNGTVKTGLSLSGGGVRAAAFHLGVLDKLNELGVLDKVDVISTVSGGSITGAYYMLHKGPFDQFKKDMKANLRKSIEWRIVFNWRILIAILSPYYSRTNVLSSVYDKLYYKKRTIHSLKEKPKIIINATSLVTGKDWKFSKSYMGDWKIGFEGKTEKVRIADAVASSSAVPGFFHPLLFKVKKYFNKPLFDVKRVGLCDGGVYDNQGTSSLINGYMGQDKCTNIICSDASYPFNSKPKTLSFRLLSVLRRQNNVMMARIKNLQYQALLYTPREDKLSVAYFSIDWTINNLLKSFVKQEELCNKLGIWVYVKQFKGRKPEEITDEEFSGAKEKIIEKLNYPEMINPLSDCEVDKISKIGTRLFALNDEELNNLMRHGAELCGFQIRTYLPELL